MFKKYSKSYSYRRAKKQINNYLELSDLDAAQVNKPDKAHTQFYNIDIQIPSSSSTINNYFNQPAFSSDSSSVSSDYERDVSMLETIPKINSSSADQIEDLEYLEHSFSEPESETSSDDDSELKKPSPNSQYFLQQWSVRNNITQTALSQLLTWFASQPDISNLPKDARTLLHTPTTLAVEVQGRGHFFYWGLTGILTSVGKKFNNSVTNFILDFGIDGLPIHKSTNISFWPIMCKIRNLGKIFVVAIYCGGNKPPLDDFLEKFINELGMLTAEGLWIEDKLFQVRIGAFCCDTPARSFIKNIKGHNGYYGCDRCCDRGQYYNNRMIFLNLNAPLRTDQDFRNKSNKDHHNGETPLSKLNIDLVSSFPIDYMHCVCLGVMRKLLFIWREGNKLHRKLNLLKLEEYLQLLKPFWPRDFNRKPRSLQDLERWKATELRQFLLYIGPITLKDILPNNMYSNFMLLNFAVTILLSSALNTKYNRYANELFRVFVKHSVHVYGKEFGIYNTHALSHLSEDAHIFNGLQDINCFPFENFLHMLKRMLRKSNCPLQQIVRRISEQNEIDIDSPIVNKSKVYVLSKKIVNFGNSDEIITHRYKKKSVFAKVEYNNTVLTNKQGDNVVILKSGVILKIFYFIQSKKDLIMLGKRCPIKKSFTNYPTDSSLLSFYEIALEENCFTVCNIEDIVSKGVVLPYKEDTFTFSPLLHLT